MRGIGRPNEGRSYTEKKKESARIDRYSCLLPHLTLFCLKQTNLTADDSHANRSLDRETSIISQGASEIEARRKL